MGRKVRVMAGVLASCREAGCSEWQDFIGFLMAQLKAALVQDSERLLAPTYDPSPFLSLDSKKTQTLLLDDRLISQQAIDNESR